MAGLMLWIIGVGVIYRGFIVIRGIVIVVGWLLVFVGSGLVLSAIAGQIG